MSNESIPPATDEQVEKRERRLQACLASTSPPCLDEDYAVIVELGLIARIKQERVLQETAHAIEMAAIDALELAEQKYDDLKAKLRRVRTLMIAAEGMLGNSAFEPESDEDEVMLDETLTALRAALDVVSTAEHHLAEKAEHSVECECLDCDARAYTESTDPQTDREHKDGSSHERDS